MIFAFSDGLTGNSRPTEIPASAAYGVNEPILGFLQFGLKLHARISKATALSHDATEAQVSVKKCQRKLSDNPFRCFDPDKST
jgi:hypothetical protein